MNISYFYFDSRPKRFFQVDMLLCRNFYKVQVFFFFLLISQIVFSQEEKMFEDSINVFLHSAEPDSVIIEKIWAFRERNQMSVALQLKVFNIEIELSRKNNLTQKECFFLQEQGYLFQMHGSTMEANTCYEQSISLATATKDTVNLTRSYYRKGYLLNGVGRSIEAIECWKKILPLRNDLRMQGFLYMVIGAAYLNVDSSDMALEYSLKAYDIMKVDSTQGQITYTLINLNSIYLNKGDLESAEKYARLGIEFATKYNDEGGLAGTKLALARTFIKLGKADEAREIYESVKGVYQKFSSNYDLVSYAYERYEVNKMTGHTAEALESLEDAYRLRDTLFRIESRNSLDDALEKHNSEKKELEIEKQKLRAENESEQKIAAEKSKSFQFYIFLVIVVVLIANAIFIYNRFRLIRIQKRTIEEQHFLVEQKNIETEFQKQLIEEKQKEILDSIAYAKRLQHAILAPQEEIDRFFPENFLLYKPKDIVAGDFYFFEATETHVYYAAADCTGHGVPGAMVSIVCSNALLRSINEFKNTDPGKILDKTRELVVATFEKSGQDVKDGMDISLVAINLKSKAIVWAGANNSLLTITNGVLTEIKPDKQPIGKADHPKPFTSHTIETQIGTEILLITDGYADQFGGEKGKKFKNSSLKELLVTVSDKPMNQQKEILNTTFENWRGQLEQIDDVCLIGIKF